MLPIEPLKPERPRIVEQARTYEQGSDSFQPDQQDGQWIKIVTADGGGGPYIVIETERWAIDPDQIDDFADMLRQTLANVGD